MCNRYTPPHIAEIERLWAVGRQHQLPWPKSIGPLGQGPFIRRRADDVSMRELVVGQWGLIPWFSTTSVPKRKDGRRLSTNNARAEDMATRASYKLPWSRGQRCIIPATSFDEPNWESGANEWWAFRRADRNALGLAGLWNTWTDKATGELHESYTMLTLNANAHPLMSRMHKPEVDPVTKRPLPMDLQDKRSVIPIEMADVDQWLDGTPDQATELLRLAPVEIFDAGPSAAAPVALF